MNDLPDLHTLYNKEPAYLRGNSNLPGSGVLDLTDMVHIGAEIDAELLLVQQAVPGYDPAHIHELACGGVQGGCIKWRWQTYGFPDGWNLLDEFSTTYMQISPAENMKRSNQTVQGFSGYRPEQLEGTGTNLQPGQSRDGMTFHIQNGVREAREKKGLLGIGGRR